MVSRQNRHQFVLQSIDVLEFVHHHVGDPLLPLLPHCFVFFENQKRELDEVVVVKPEALLFLVEIPVENDVLRRRRFAVAHFQVLHRHRDEVAAVVGTVEKLFDFDHVPGLGKGHVL